MEANLDAETHAIAKSSLESQQEHKLRSKLSGIIQFHNKQCQTRNKPKNKPYCCLYLFKTVFSQLFVFTYILQVRRMTYSPQTVTLSLINVWQLSS